VFDDFQWGEQEEEDFNPRADSPPVNTTTTTTNSSPPSQQTPQSQTNAQLPAADDWFDIPDF